MTNFVSVPQEVSDLLILKNRVESSEYHLDRVFGPSSKQEDLFCEVSELVESALDGNQVCILAYGQTRSGKTFTMEGSAREIDPKSC
jgi:hypothetical protein